MVDNLHRVGTILLTNIAHNDHFRFAGLLAEHQTTLHRYIEGLASIDEVVYVIVTGSDGRILAQYSKGAHRSATGSERSSTDPLYPDVGISRQVARAPATAPQITPLVVSDRLTLEPREPDDSWFFPFPTLSETLYDFALLVLRKSVTPLNLFPALAPDDPLAGLGSMDKPAAYGIVQIGLTDAFVRASVLTMIQKVSLLSSRRSARSDVVEAETWAEAPPGARNSFSGEIEGAVARPPLPSGTSQSSANSALPAGAATRSRGATRRRA